jgi:cytoskeleton protein RodZ
VRGYAWDHPNVMTPAVGQSLREARVGRGIELSAAEQETKIRAKYLRAMEDEQWELLPGEPYTRGFLVSYAEFLGLDPDPLVADYRRDHPRADEPIPIPETMLPQRALGGWPPTWASGAVVVGLIVAAALAVIGVIALTGGSEDDGHGGGRPANGPASTTASTTHDESTPHHPTRVALELRSSGTVWVCLVDDRGRPLIDAETLTPDEQRGPFKARGFRVTFGNGAIAMTVDDQAVAIPDLGEPFGYSIGSNGVDRLGPSARPTCV